MLKIALCDDDAVFLKELTGKIQELLRFEEKNAAIASFVNPTALTASVASGDRFDIFILDVEMPQIDGFKVAADLRKYQPNVALIFLSCIFIFLLSPIRSTKHPLSERLYAQNKKTARIIVSIDFLLFLILYITGMPTRYLATWSLSLSAVAIMMVITLFEKNSTRRESV